jgi:three-Cys-motif partner protein
MKELGMDKFLLPEDDGLLVRNSGEWVKEKLFYVKRYIDIFEVAMRDKNWRRRIFIDLFSGPGKCIIRDTNEYILGSPILALQTQYPFTDYFFADLDSQNIESLKARSKASKVSNAHISFAVGDANQQVYEIVSTITGFDKKFVQGLLPCLNLAFLDPEGLELEWKTVEALAGMKRMDLIIHYSQNGLTRNLERCSSSQEETIIDKFFGDRYWRNVYKNVLEKKEMIGIHRALIDYYKSKLRDLGYVVINDSEEIIREPLIRNTKRKAPLYRLIFASKHSLGNKIWNEVTKTDVYGQGKLPL